MQSIMHTPLFSVEYRREAVDVRMMSSSRVPDAKWKFVDKKKHGHFWDGGKLPTLKKVKVGTTWVGDEYDGSEISIYEHHCRQCNEKVEPGYRSEYGPSTIAGPTWLVVSFDDPESMMGREEHVLTPEQYVESVGKWRDSMREITRR